ncbi:MAG: hypothetical protein M1834_003065 [Cirrosporium novae-zelandiae]|nr:MAG: hypothetical protein M1834_003065 [Cirrosporium novae-zelandiae]
MSLKYFTLLTAFFIASLIPNLASASTNINITDFSNCSTITRDILVIGGGSAGTYAAIRLQSLNQSVIVVEEKDRLGGHTETFTSPTNSSQHVDYGVEVWHNNSIVNNYVSSLGVELASSSYSTAGITPMYVNFKTGKVVQGYEPPNSTAVQSALEKYALQLAKYPYLDNGFDLPDPVPEDLLIPFGEFADKYDLHAAVPTFFNFGQGLGDFLKQPTLYVMKLLGLTIIEGMTNGFIASVNHDNSELYEKAAAVLGEENILLNSHVVAMDRNETGCIKVLVDTPAGKKLILAEKIVVAIPPKLNNLAGFDLDSTEQSLFKQFTNTAYYTCLLWNTGIPENVVLYNTAPNTTDNLPYLPGIYTIASTRIPGLETLKYGSASPIPISEVKADIVNSILRLNTVGTLNTTTPEFAVLKAHVPFELTVPADAIADGFYKKAVALQGYRNTFWTGAAWQTHDSSLIWQYTEGLLGNITEA